MSQSSERSTQRCTTVHHKKLKKMGIFGTVIGSPFSYLLLVIFQLLHQHCMAVAGDILIPPKNVTMPINTGDAVFFCQAAGTNTKWIVDGQTHDSGNLDKNGFTFTEVIFSSNVHNMTISIPSVQERNETSVRCLAFNDGSRSSEEVFLIVMGGPATPEPIIRTISSSHLTLEWAAPFTWPGHPIQQYTLSSNHSLYYSSEMVLSVDNMSIDKKEGINECDVMEFSVKANNGLADSEAGTITGGFPIAPDTSMASISETITFNTDLTPLIKLDIQLPRVCWYQDIEYSITLSRMDMNDGVEVATITAQRRKYWEGNLITGSFRDNLVNGATYRATLDFQTFAEEDNTVSAAVQISKTFDIPDPNPEGRVSTPDVSGVRPGTLTVDNIILIGIVGGVVVLLLFVFVAIVVLACVNVRKRALPSARPNLQNRPLPMVTNPIYEGAVYETVDHHLNSLSSSSLERPKTPTTPTSIAPLLTESPYAVTTIDSNYEMINPPQYHQQFSTNEHESYTIMTSAAGANKAMEQSQESNLDQDVRYAPEPGSVIVTVSDW